MRNPPTPAKSSATLPTGLVGSLYALDLYATYCLQVEAYEVGLTRCGIDAPMRSLSAMELIEVIAIQLGVNYPHATT